MTKTILVMFLSALLVFSIFTQDVEAEKKFIGYGSMKGDTISCSKKNPGSCKQQPANPYKRGCEAAKRCRGGA